MTDVWIAPGHGRRPDGTLDPGASAGSKTEQSEGDLIVGHATDRLRNHYGLKVYRQPRGGPNFPGSITHINSLRPTVAIEVHHDWIGAPRGAFGHWHSSSTPAMRLANAMYSRIFRAGLPVRPSWHRARNELAIVRNTVVPTVLWECDRIGSVANHRQYGHALADGIADHLGVEQDRNMPTAKEVVDELLGRPISYYHEGRLPNGHWPTERLDTLLGRIRSRSQETKDAVGAHLPAKYTGPTLTQIVAGVFNHPIENPASGNVNTFEERVLGTQIHAGAARNHPTVEQIVAGVVEALPPGHQVTAEGVAAELIRQLQPGD